MLKLKDRRFTFKENRFIRFYIESGNASDAALKAGYKQRQSGYENLTKPYIQESFKHIADQVGITDEAIAKLLKAGLEADTGNEVKDFLIRHKYIDTILRLKGYLTKGKKSKSMGSCYDNFVMLYGKKN